MISKSNSETAQNEMLHQEFQRINNEVFEITFNNVKYTIQTYKEMISILPQKLSMLQQSISVEQMIEIVDFFRLLIKFPDVPQEITNQNFILTLLIQVQRFQNDVLLSKFALFINEYYSDEFYSPPNQLMEFVVKIIFNVKMPLQVIQQKIISNLLVFLCSTSDYLDDKLINNQAFYTYLSSFLNLSLEFVQTLTYLFSVLINRCSSNEVLLYFTTIIDLTYKYVIPIAIQSIRENPVCYNVILNITSLISGFAEQNKKLHKNYFKQNVMQIIPPLYQSFWGISEDINYNLIDILETVAKIAISLFSDPNSAELQVVFLNIITACLSNGGTEIILSSIMSTTDYSTESLLLLKSLIHINFTKNTTFLFKDQNEFFPIFRRVIYFCIDGKIPERCAAGICLSKIIRICPNCMLQYLICNQEICSCLSINLANIYDICDLAFIGLISELMVLDNEKLARDLFKALFVISKKFYDMDKMHEFREECALYNIEEKVNSIIENPQNTKTAELGDRFILTAFGALPYSEV